MFFRKLPKQDPIDSIPDYIFWRDGLNLMARKACMALRLAGAPVTPANIARFIDSAPRDSRAPGDETWQRNSFCNAVLQAAFDRNAGNEAVRDLNEYFLRYFPERPWRVQDMLCATFLGIMAAIGEEFPETSQMGVNSAHP